VGDLPAGVALEAVGPPAANDVGPWGCVVRSDFFDYFILFYFILFYFIFIFNYF